MLKVVTGIFVTALLKSNPIKFYNSGSIFASVQRASVQVSWHRILPSRILFLIDQAPVACSILHRDMSKLRLISSFQHGPSMVTQRLTGPFKVHSLHSGRFAGGRLQAALLCSPHPHIGSGPIAQLKQARVGSGMPRHRPYWKAG